MKNFILKTAMVSAAAVCFSLSYAAAKEAKTVSIPASDSRITYVGRTLTEDGNVSFDWSGTTVRVKFSGKYLAVKASDTKANYFNVWVDEVPGYKEHKVIRTAGKDTVIVLAENLKKGEHFVTLQKRTEGEQGTVTFSSFITDGELLQADGLKERHIEFIGDSYTCGYGTENSVFSDPFKPETENANLTYAAIASRYFNADCTTICHSGQGVARNYDSFGGNYTMTDRYSQVFDESKEFAWTPDKAAFRPDIVVIYLGANDFSTGLQPSFYAFSERYRELLGKVKAFYGEEIPILCIAVKMDPNVFEYVKGSCESADLKNVYYMTMQDKVHNPNSDLGASYHPNYKGHKKMASVIIPYISTITGWEMDEKPYL